MSTETVSGGCCNFRRGCYIIVMCGVAVLLSILAGFAPPGAAVTGFTFMKIGVGARPVALGQAFTAVADDAHALFYNPAGLIQGFNASVTLCEMLDGVSYVSGGLVTPVFRKMGVGFGGGYLSATDVRRDRNGAELGTFGLSDFCAGPGFAFGLSRWLALGACAKFVYSRLDSFSAWAVSFDGGVLFRPLKDLSIGASLLHLGTPRRFIEALEYPPVNLRGGAAYRIPIQTHYALFSCDLSVYPDYGPTFGAGVEGRFDLAALGSNRKDILYLRGGYQSGGHLGGFCGFSFGIGYETSFRPGLNLLIDAVYLSYGLLGDAQRVSLGFRWTGVRGGR